MASTVESTLTDLGVVLPSPAAPVANYVPFLIEGQQLFISGQLPIADGNIQISGQLGQTVSVEEGQKAARLCAINILAQAKLALGDLDKISQCLRLGGYVNAAPTFYDHPAVINGASDLISTALGQKGKHTRFAVGCSSLPLNAAVEVDALFSIA